MTTNLESESHSDELRVLRARAYGPAADIADDPAALRRLAELEALARDPAVAERAEHDEAPPVADDTPVTDDTPVAERADRVDGAEAPPALDDTPVSERAERVEAPPPAADTPAAERVEAPPPADDAPVAERAERDDAQKPWYRRTRNLWIASVAASALFASAATAWTVQQGDGTRVAVLRADPDAEWPSGFFGGRPAGGVIFEDYNGVTAALVPQNWNEDEPLDCLYVIVGDGGASGPATGACSVEPFGPQAALTVVADAPEELRERHPEGTALQFAVEGDEVHVYAVAP